MSNSDRGGVLVITDPPPTLDFGIDCMNYETGSEFRGVCMIPPGLHFVYYSTGMGSRQGFFLHFEKNEVVVKSWDRSTEDISYSPQLSEETIQTLVAAVHHGALDKQLGPYPLRELKSWQNLSNFITADTLQLAGAMPHTPLYPGDAEDISMTKSKATDHQDVQPYFPDAARVAKYCDIRNYETIVRDAIRQSEEGGNSISAFYMDKSELLEYIVANYFSDKWEGLLGELQLAFSIFMLLFSYPALQQWKLWIDTVCRCERLLLTRQDFACAFVRVFYQQLQFSPADFFETEISSDNFLRPAVSNLFETLASPETNDTLREHGSRLLLFMQKKFGLFEDANLSLSVSESQEGFAMDRFNIVAEDMPVIVDISEAADSPGPRRQQQQQQQQQQQGREAEDSAAMFQAHKAALECAIDSLTPSWREGGSTPTGFADGEAGASCAQESGDDGHAADDLTSLAPHEVRVRNQEAMFSWRYPALFDAMELHNRAGGAGREDLAMTAVRLMDECGEAAGNEGAWKSAREEALRFIEDEMSKWGVA
jgi:A1 cistron-splicing factor AAR2